MSGEAQKLGPFTGGMNTFSDASSIDDTELSDLVNLEVDLDGSLVSRPPIVVQGSVGGAVRMRLLGYFQTVAANYLIGASSTGTYYWNGAVWTLITATECSAMAQYKDKAFLLGKEGGTNGGWWTPGGGYTALAAMPTGAAIVIYKARLVVVKGKTATSNGSRVYFSNSPTDPTIWDTANDFINVSDGDGQNIVDIIVYNDNLIVFKTDSTWSVSYETTPGKSINRLISGTVGASDKDCVVAYEDVIYTLHEGRVYEINNYQFTRINAKCPFIFEALASGTFIDEVIVSLLGDRLVVRYYKRVYVFNLRTRTWSRWDSTLLFGYLIAEPVNILNNSVLRYFAGGCVTTDTNLYKIEDGFVNNISEAMTCTMITKVYSWTTHTFKRLFHWGVDAFLVGAITGSAYPVTQTFRATWNDLATKKWSELASNTWDQPLTTPGVVTATVGETGVSVRKFIYFPKALRFRQIYFKVDIPTTGSPATSPVRVFSLIAFVANKAKVPKLVN